MLEAGVFIIISLFALFILSPIIIGLLFLIETIADQIKAR